MANWAQLHFGNDLELVSVPREAEVPVSVISYSNPSVMTSLSEQMKALEPKEDLLKENPHRYVMFPIKYLAIWEM